MHRDSLYVQARSLCVYKPSVSVQGSSDETSPFMPGQAVRDRPPTSEADESFRKHPASENAPNENEKGEAMDKLNATFADCPRTETMAL